MRTPTSILERTLGRLLVIAGALAQGCGFSTYGDGTEAPSGPAQGASRVVVSAAGPGCPISGITTWSIPAEGSTSSAHVGAQAVDGVDGATVDCSVRKVGDSLTVLATLQSADNVVFAVGAADLAPLPSGSAYERAGDISHYASGTETLRGLDCTITLNRLQRAHIGSGKIWADFSCPTFFDPTSPASVGCSATGTFAFRNCTR
jgi:hypothetical protein